MLKSDTIDHLDWVAKGLSRQRKCDISRSEAVEYLVQRHWIKVQKRVADRRHEQPKLVTGERNYGG